LKAVEQKLSDYKAKNAGRLPDELQTNITQMNALDQRSSSLSEAATRNAERRMMLESELRARKDRLAALKKNNYQSAAGGDRISDLISKSAITNRRSRHERSLYRRLSRLQAARDRLVVLKKQRDDAFKNAAKNEPTTVAESPSLGENEWKRSSRWK